MEKANDQKMSPRSFLVESNTSKVEKMQYDHNDHMNRNLIIDSYPSYHYQTIWEVAHIHSTMELKN